MNIPNSPAHPLRCLVGIATYNEIENLPLLVDEIFARLPDCKVLVVDDNSPDGTGRWCQARSLADDRFRAIVRPGKLGLGTAVMAKMRYAMDHDFDLLLTLDADHSHAPSEIHRLLSAIERTDVAIGSRYVRGGKIVNWPWYRKRASRMANMFAQRILGVNITDCSSGFRCYRVAKLRELDLHAISSAGYAFYEEVIWRLQRLGARFIEVPITFSDRTTGRSKAGIAQVAAAIFRLLTLRLRG